jgi:hypothetical protein
MNRITKKDLEYAEKDIIKKYGYKKYVAAGRYGYIGIDEYDAAGNCVRTYRTGLTKKEAYNCLCDPIYG